MFDDDDRIALVHQGLQHLEQLVHVFEVQAGGRLVEDVHGFAVGSALQLGGKLDRMLPYLKTGGHVVVSTRAVKPVTATLSGFDYDAPQMLDYLKANVPNLTFVNADQACSDIGSSKVLNMVLLGAAIRTGVLDFTISEIESIMKQTLPEKFHEMNLRALNYNI